MVIDNDNINTTNIAISSEMSFAGKVEVSFLNVLYKHNFFGPSPNSY